MHYEIEAAVQSVGKQLNPAQRASSNFSEAPRIGSRTLRRGMALKFTEAEMRASEVTIKNLYNAHAIEIYRVDGDSRVSMRDQMAGKAPVEPKKVAPPAVMVPPPPPPEAPPAPVLPPEPVPNEAFPTPEQLKAAVDLENKQTEQQIEQAVEKLAPVEESHPAPSAPRPASTEKSSKKGKR